MQTTPRMRRSLRTKERRRENARRFLEELDADPNDYLVALGDVLRNIEAVVLYSRVSDDSEDLAAHERWLLDTMRFFGIEVLDKFAGVEKGYHFTPELRPKLYAASESARCHSARLDIDIPIVTPALSRGARSQSWSICNQYAEPTRAEFERFAEFTKGVTVVTWLRPDAGYDWERWLFSNLKEKNGGRQMLKKNLRKLLQPRAEELQALGMSYRAIARTFLVEYEKIVAPMTIHGWLTK